jgi:voltage-gated potassium channel
VLAVDIAIGVAVLLDLAARLWISERKPRELLRVSTWADIAAVVAFLAPVFGHGAGFLRILRTLRLLRTYLVARLRADGPFFCRNEEVIVAVTNLSVFIFVMTRIVYATQHQSNPAIRHYVDAL